ncbi:MAG TPA: Uma2 family endonuclease, partial [Thermoanaerobaculia bacterium]|nr:Uma2 family endonuclease [Thermoanaerobaculia bacterium]
EEGRPPCLVIEITSDSTRREDLHRKKDCYARLGVDEYFLHDPLGDYLKPPLRGLRLVDGRYQPIESGPDGSLESLATGVVIQQEGKGLRLTEVSTGKLLPNLSEFHEWMRAERAAEEAMLAKAEARARLAEAAQEEAESRLRALEQEIARLRRESR